MPPKREFTFVLRTQEDQAGNHKKQLKSVINTHVAFRAHEQRRERKKRQNKAAESTHESSPSPDSDPSLESSKARSHDQSTQNKVQSPDAAETRSDRIKFGSTSVSDRSAVRKQLNALYSDQKNFDTFVDESGSAAQQDQENHRRNSALIPLGFSRDVADWSNIPGTSLNGKTLDPFLRFPVTLNPEDQSLIRYWYTDAQTLIFGVDATAPFCPLRDWSFQNVQLHEIALQWVLVSAEQHLASMRQQSSSSSLLRRRAQGYAALNEILNSPKADLDKAYVGIIMAIMADSLLGRPELLKMHVKGLDLLLRERGGIQSLLENPLAALPPFCVTMQYTYAECDIQTLRELETIKTRFMRAMKTLRQHSLEMRSQLRQARASSNVNSYQQIQRHPSDVDPVVPYAELKRDVFYNSSIGAIIWTPYDVNSSFSQKAGHFMILFSLGCTFMYFGTRHLMKTVFLKRLKFIAERSSAFDPETEASLLLPAQLASMISHVRQEVQGHFEDDNQALAEEVKACAATIDALKMFGFLGDANRAQLIGLLQDWLFRFREEKTGPPDQEHERDTEVLAAVSAEIVQTWYLNRRDDQTRQSPIEELETDENG